MRYADTLLTQGEVIVVRARQHWLALFLDARTAVALWIIGVLMLVAVVIFTVTDRAIRDILSYIGIGAILLGVLVFLYHLWHWWSQDYLVTNRRILKVEGVFNKHAADSSLEKINDAVLDQNIVGRMLNYGDLDILTAADSAIDRYKMLDKAPAFKREMLQQKYALETEFAYHAPPTPPLRATTDGPEAERRDEQPSTVIAAGPREEARHPSPPRDVAPAVTNAVEDAAAAPGMPAGAPIGTAPAAAEAPTPAERSAPAEAPMLAEAPTPATLPAAPARPRLSDSDATTITQTLARLADLRDRGAITPEEYQSKKDELLDRL